MAGAERDGAQCDQAEEPDTFGKSQTTTRRLQGMLKRVSQSSFQKPYKTLMSTSESNESPPSDSQMAATDRSIWNPFASSPQNGDNSSLAKDNPFYTRHEQSVASGVDKESSSKPDSGDLGEASLATIFAPPPQFQNTPPDGKPPDRETEDVDVSPGLTVAQIRDIFKSQTLTRNTAVVSLQHPKTVDASEATPSPTRQNLFETPLSKRTDLLHTPLVKAEDLTQALPSKGVDSNPTSNTVDPSHPTSNKADDGLLQESSSKGADLFKAPHNEEEDLFQAPPTKSKDLFQAPPTKAKDLFQAPPTKSKDLFQAPPTKAKDLFQAPPTEDGLFQSTATKGEDLFQAPPTKAKDLFQAPPTKAKDLFQALPTKEDGLFQSTATKGEDLFQAPPTKPTDLFLPEVREAEDPFNAFPPKLEDPFRYSISNGDDLFYAPALYSKDPFQTSPAEREDPFRAFAKDPFQDSTTKRDDPFQGPASFTKDPFQPFPTMTPDPFQPDDPFNAPAYASPDAFQPSETWGVSKDRAVFQTTPDDPAPSPSPTPSDIFPSSSSFEKAHNLFKPSPSDSVPPTLPEKPHNIFKPTPSNSVPPTPPDKPHNIFLTTPLGTKHGIARPTLTSLEDDSPQARTVSPMPTPDGLTQTRKTPDGPPTPAPRTKPGKLLNQLRESKSEDVEDYKVFENILLIGQERCVEDWPEDSPQLCPDFRPSGKLRLRRESLRREPVKVAADYEGASEEDVDENGTGKHGKPKKSRKFKVSFISRRGSKDKFGDDLKAGDSGTLQRGSVEGYLDEDPPRKGADLFSGGELYHDEEQNGGLEDRKTKKPLKQRVSQMLRRGSKDKFGEEPKPVNGHIPSYLSKDTGLYSEEGEEEEEEGEECEGTTDFKRRKKLTVKFVPQRGFSFSLDKIPQDQSKGNTLQKGSKVKRQDEVKGAHGYTPRKQQSKGDLFEDMKGMKSYSPQPEPKDDFSHDVFPQKGADLFFDGEQNRAMDDCKPKTTTKLKLPHASRGRSKSLQEAAPACAQDYSLRRRSQEGYLDERHPPKGADLFSAEEYDDQYEMEDCKPKKTSKFKAALTNHWKSKEAVLHENAPRSSEHRSSWRPSADGFLDAEPQRGGGFGSPAENSEDDHDGTDDCKPKKPFKFKGPRRHRKGSKGKATTDPPGATSSDYYRSEAAEAEWCSAQIDERLAGGLEEGEEEEEEGDTDSLMEWWNTVEQWDEVPSDEEDKSLKEDETKSFTSLADKVHRGLRLFNKVFTERAEFLWQHVITLHAIADDISSFHKKAKIGNITGGTTAAVGGVAAITGLALAPVTFGASLIVTAVGIGVAAAGGITSASATISDNVNNMHDRKKVEVVLENYEARLEDVARVLRFVLLGLWRMKGHPLLRAGTQHYSGDWEVRRAVHMVGLVDRPAARAGEVTEGAVAAVQSLFRGMDKYFTKDSRELKKGCKSEVVGQIKHLAQVLQQALVELNGLREELQDANGGT